MKPDLVVLGNLIVDDVVFADGSTRFAQPGGAALYAALGAALWGVGVGIGSVIGVDYPPEVLEALDERGIDLTGIRRTSAPGMRTWLLYEGRRRQVVHRLDSPAHAEMSPQAGELPTHWRPSAVHLAPMPLAVQDAWLEWLANSENVLTSIDPYELVDETSVERCMQTFTRADILLLSEDELLLAETLEDPLQGIKTLSTNGAPGSRLRHMVLKRGKLGGISYDTETRVSSTWPPVEIEITESTGAGDAFAGGLMAGLLQGRSFEKSLEQGAVSASFALSGAGVTSLLGAREADARGRLEDWFGESHVA